MTAVSIIIPTHNRRARVVQTLQAITQQTISMQQLEVIVVADGCVDDTVPYLRSLTFPFALKICEQPGLGPATARNSGASAAAGKLLIFIDDDIEVVPCFVAAHLAAHETSGATVAIGHLPMAAVESPTFFEQGIRSWWNGKFFNMRQPGYRFAYDDLFSGNFSITASFFAQVSGFNTDLWCHEDYELGLRLLEANAIFVYAAAATGVHHDQTDMGRVLRRHYAEGKADVYLVQRYPELAMNLPLATASYSLLSRGLRFLAFRAPKVGDWLADVGLKRLSILEWLWLNGAWSYFFYHLHDYWYWRGVADHVDSPAAVAQFFAQTEVEEVAEPPELTLDLANGVDEAARALDEKRPSSLRLTFHNALIADLPAEIGKERLRGSHLRRLLTTHLSGKAIEAIAYARAQNGRSASFDPTRRLIPPERQNDAAWTTSHYFYRSKKVAEIELTTPLQPIDLDGHSGLHALVRYQGQPVNWITLVDLPSGIVPVDLLQQAIAEQVGWSLVPMALMPPRKVKPFEPTVSVVVCTRDRAEQLATCLDALLAQDYLNYELIVVDNASKTADTAQLAARLPVRYVREDRPGLDWARNRGAAEARHDIVVFTDDDARPDAGWLRAVAAAFAEPEVMAVTGPVVPAELDTPAQNLFEFGYGGMSHGFERRIIRRSNRTDADLLWASSFGVGANMAFRRTLFEYIAPFDVALDVGTPSNGGGDVEMLHRVVAAGHTLVYEPNALVWHEHRRSDADFERLVKNNGRSFACYLLTCARNRTVSRRAVAAFATKQWFFGWIVNRLRNPNGFPRKFVLMEMMAFFAGPIAYRRTRRHASQIAGRSPALVDQPPATAMEQMRPAEQTSVNTP